MKEKGLIQVYTGNGKGKTTAAFGLALRAAGRGYRTFIGQFMKGQDYGELHAINKLHPLIIVEQFGLKEFVHPEKPRPIDFEMARKGLARMQEVVEKGEYDIVVFDEINVTVHFGLLSAEEVMDIVQKRPPGTEIVFTGRYAPDAFIKAADLVTEMIERKHYYRKGVSARKGIEF